MTTLAPITAVFSEVIEWIVGAMESVLTVFYADGALTFFGLLGLAGLAISIFLMIMNVVSSFLHFRG